MKLNVFFTKRINGQEREKASQLKGKKSTSSNHATTSLPLCQ